MQRQTDDATDRRTEHRISESADKLTVKLNLKRGSGTRDQDKGTIKAKGDSPEAVADDLERTLDELEDRNLFNRVRDTQPGQTDE
jgi:hypothetical protein